MRVFMVVLLLFAFGCAKEEKATETKTEDTGPTIADDLKPLSVSINANKPLIGVLQDDPSTLNTNTQIENINNTSMGLTILSNPNFLGTEPPTNFAGFDPNEVAIPSVILGVNDFSIDLSITASLPTGAIPSCVGLNSWETVLTQSICTNALNSYVLAINSGDIQGESLRVSVSSTNGEAGDFLVSTALPSHRIRLRQVSDLNPSGNDGISNVFSFNDVLYFSSNFSGSNKLYKLGASITQISNLGTGNDDVGAIVKADGKFYFQGNGPVGTKIFSYSGIPNDGFNQISNLHSFSSDALGDGMGVLDGKLYFSSSRTSSYEDRLMVYDGTNISAVNYDLYSGGVDRISSLKVLGNYVYFQGIGNDGLKKLWRYDPIYAAGVGRIEKVADLYDGFDDNINNLEILNNFIYFSGKNAIGREKLFKLDPATKQSKQLSSTNIIGEDNILEVKELGGKIYLSARNTSGQQKLFMYDPSRDKFFQLTNFYSGNENPQDFTLYGDFIYFSVVINAAGHRKLFIFDRVSNTLVQASDINAGASDEIGNIVVANSVLYFTASVAGEQKLFRLCDEAEGCSN